MSGRRTIDKDLSHVDEPENIGVEHPLRVPRGYLTNAFRSKYISSIVHCGMAHGAALGEIPNIVRTKDINRLQILWDITQDVADLSLVGNIDLDGCNPAPSLNAGPLVSIQTGICYLLQSICPTCEQYEIGTTLKALV